MLIRLVAPLIFLIAAGGCGGGPAAPTQDVVNEPPPPPPERWAIEGRVTTYGTGGGISGALVTPETGAAVQTDASGNYRIASTTLPASTSMKVKVEGAGLVTREFNIHYQPGVRNAVDVNVIRLAPPFSLEFYRQLVRDAYDNTSGSLELVWRLPSSPRFYVRTVDQNGRAVEPEVLKVVLPSIERGVTAWSNGSLSVAALETGKETRERTEGWIIVNITRNYKSTYCGKAYVGSTIGEIELVDDRCSCGSNKISGAIVMHEVGHAMGFFHVNDRGSVMYPYVPGRCPPGSLSENERYHSALAYGRTRGNADPDSDHPSAQTIRPGDDGPGLQIEN